MEEEKEEGGAGGSGSALTVAGNAVIKERVNLSSLLSRGALEQNSGSETSDGHQTHSRGQNDVDKRVKRKVLTVRKLRIETSSPLLSPTLRRVNKSERGQK